MAGLPIVLFLAFAAATLLVCLTTCLLLGLIASLTITFFVVGFALLFVVPTVVIASCSATFIFVWGLVGYIILRRLNEGQAPAKPGTRVGDKLQALTGGRSVYWQQHQTSSKESRNGHQPTGKDNATGPERNYTNDPTGSGDGGPVNGMHGSIAWERKLVDGVQPDSVVLDTDNVYEVLKEVSTTQNRGDELLTHN